VYKYERLNVLYHDNHNVQENKCFSEQLHNKRLLIESDIYWMINVLIDIIKNNLFICE